jgi:hypothetical protein
MHMSDKISISHDVCAVCTGEGGEGGGHVFLFRSEFFFRTTRVIILFFPQFSIRLYDNKFESDFFFPPPKSEYFFQQHWESEYLFNPPPSGS